MNKKLYSSLEIESEVVLTRTKYIVRISLNNTPQDIISILNEIPKNAVVEMVEESDEFDDCVEIRFVVENLK